MDSVSPVWSEDHVPAERVIALDQEEYFPIIVLPILYGDGTHAMAVRFRLSDQERSAIAGGGDIVITELVHGGFTPISIQICAPGTRPD
jgi:hypothetical protein